MFSGPLSNEEMRVGHGIGVSVMADNVNKGGPATDSAAVGAVQAGDANTDRFEHLEGLSDEELKERFWSLANDIVKPLYEMAYTHTSPSIERSVMLRMGFSSLEANAVVSEAAKRGLLGKGAGHLALKYAQVAGFGQDYLEAGRTLAKGEGWDALKSSFQSDGGGKA